MNIRVSQERHAEVGRVLTEHDDELIELMAGLFGNDGEFARQQPDFRPRVPVSRTDAVIA